MSGYAGPDDESLHAIILNENAIEHSRKELFGQVLTYCSDCGEKIDSRRVEFLSRKGMKCECCVPCQSVRDKAPRQKVKMLDHVL